MRESTAKKIIKKGKENIENLVTTDNRIFSECLNVIAATKEGQYVLNKLMDDCGQNRSSASLDLAQLSYNEGKRSVWLGLQKYINVKNQKLVIFTQRRAICSTKQKIQEKV